jgi:ubiquinone/menaquinone biosynthesis C-methylase UbiE
LRSNLRAAGVDARATIQPGDMRRLPFEPASFDAVLSTYAMDHVGRDDSRLAVREAARVLKPGGDFLLMVLAKDVWLNVTFGPLLLHGGLRGAGWWDEALRAAGFAVTESGTQPATLYFLARKPR